MAYEKQPAVRFTYRQLQYLEQLYPAKAVSPQDNIQQIMYEAGKQHVLKGIRERADKAVDDHF